MANPTAKPIPLAEVNTRFRNRCSGMTGSAACLLRLLTHCCGIGLGSRHADLSQLPQRRHMLRAALPPAGWCRAGGRRCGPVAWAAAVRSRGPLPRTGPLRSRPVPGPCGPGRCWSWPLRPRPRCGPGGSASRRRPGSGWSPRCRESGPRCTWTPRSPSRRRSLRRLCAARLAGSRGLDQRPDPAVRQVVRDLLLRPRHGRAGGLSPAGPGRGGTGTVARHHPRVLPAGPGPGHGDRAGPACCAPTLTPQETDRTATGPQDQPRPGPPPGPPGTRRDRPRTRPQAGRRPGPVPRPRRPGPVPRPGPGRSPRRWFTAPPAESGHRLWRRSTRHA